MTKNVENALDIEIAPKNLLSPITTQKLLNELVKIEGIKKIMVQGPRLPSTVPYGPAKGDSIHHSQRQLIQITSKIIELSVCVGRVRLEVENSIVKDSVKLICKEILPCDFEFNEGLFILKRSTTTDYAKRGANADKIALGLSDPKKSEDKQICMLN